METFISSSWVVFFAYLLGLFSFILTAGSLIYVGLQIKSAKEFNDKSLEQNANFYKLEELKLENEKIARAWDYMRRYNDPTFRCTIPIVRRWIDILADKNKNDTEKIKEINGNSEEKSHLALYCNFFEEMAEMYNMNLINRDLIKLFFKGTSIQMNKALLVFIELIREQRNNNQLYVEWESMNTHLQGKAIVPVDSLKPIDNPQEQQETKSKPKIIRKSKKS